ncbi:MAG: metallophosphatase family protein [bacterium]|nr:metallophosphatase family protein [bacterium]
MSTHKVAVISDTHSLLRPEITEKIKECELIVHAGDIASKEAAEKIKALGTTYFVRGNADKDSWADGIPVSRELELFGLKIFVIHNRRQIQEDVSDKDIVIYGHSHKYSEEYKEKVCYFNPGSCGPRRFHQEITMAILTIDEEDRSFSFEKVDCLPQLMTDSTEPPDKDMAKLIGRIMKQMDAGKPVNEIVKRNGIDEKLANQILQIYTTHQGIDVQGVLDRMDIWGK